jgi:hypothetical protein
MSEPIAASTSPSASDCRRMRHCPDPSADLMANSFERSAARASCRFVTFTHAMSITPSTAASIE